MEDMAAIVSYVHDGDHVESDDSVESNPDHYEPVEKKPRLDTYEKGYSVAYERDGEDEDEDEHTDVSSLDSTDCEYGPEGRKLSVQERKTKKKIRDWVATIKAEDIGSFFDTSGALPLNVDIRDDTSLLHNLSNLLLICKRRITIYTFIRPDDDRCEEDSGPRAYESYELGELELESYSTKVREVIQQFNATVTNKHSNSQLEFVSFIRSVNEFPYRLYITFIARQKGNGQIGTYQAALLDDYFDDEVHLVFLRHVEADKILAILSLAGYEKELRKMYGEGWHL